MVIIENNIVKLDGKAIGLLNGKVLTMRRNTARHFYRVLNAWCINVEVVNSGAERFIIDTEKRERFVVRLSVIQALRARVNVFVTCGQERKLAIPLQCWDKYSHDNLSFPVFIGIPPDEFVETCTGRWRSRLIAYRQMEISMDT